MKAPRQTAQRQRSQDRALKSRADRGVGSRAQARCSGTNTVGSTTLDVRAQHTATHCSPWPPKPTLIRPDTSNTPRLKIPSCCHHLSMSEKASLTPDENRQMLVVTVAMHSAPLRPRPQSHTTNCQAQPPRIMDQTRRRGTGTTSRHKPMAPAGSPAPCLLCRAALCRVRELCCMPRDIDSTRRPDQSLLLPHASALATQTSRHNTQCAPARVRQAVNRPCS